MAQTPHHLLTMGSDIRIEQVDPPRSPKDLLPTMYDLPSEAIKEPGLPDEFHDLQPQLLSRSLSLVGYSRENYFTASDLNLYYAIRHPLWYKRPDWFLVLNVPRLYEQRDLRRSYVLWQEDHAPYVVIEFLSPETEAEDLGRFSEATAASIPAVAVPTEDLLATSKKPPGKFEVYETQLRVPHYFVYNRYTQCLRYFKLDGGQYQAQALNPDPPLVWLADLEIGLGIWQSEFEGVITGWLRWCNSAGDWLLTDTEQAQQQVELERQAVALERQAKELAQTQLLQAAQNLLATGMTLEQVTQIFNLSAAQVAALNSLR